MGQKTNPIIFRINKTKEWKANYIEKKSNELYLYTLQQLEIKKFITNFFLRYKLKVKECRINYTNTFLNIYVSYFQYKSSLVNLDNIQEKQNINLRYNKKFKLKKKLIKLIYKNSNQLRNFTNYNDLIYSKKLIKRKKRKKRRLYFFLSKIKKNKKVKQRLKLLYRYKQFLILKKNKKISNLDRNYFLKKFFESLKLFLNKNIRINLTLKSLNNKNKKKIDKTEQAFIKKKFIKFEKYDKLDIFKEGINLLYTAIKTHNSSEFIANFISIALQKNKKHNFVLKFLNDFFLKFKYNKISKIITIKIQIKGRFNRSRRARKKTYFIGHKMQMLKLDSNINYAEDISITANGTFGIKVWIFEKKNLNYIDNIKKINVKRAKKNKIQKNKKRKISKIRI